MTILEKHLNSWLSGIISGERRINRALQPRGHFAAPL